MLPFSKGYMPFDGETQAVGAIFCINPGARRFQRRPFYNHVFENNCLAGAFVFLRNQVGPNQVIPIKLGSKTYPEISSWMKVEDVKTNLWCEAPFKK